MIEFRKSTRSIEPTNSKTDPHEWTPNEERGLYKTMDGGKTWKKILYVDKHTGINDLVLDPRGPAFCMPSVL